MDKYLKIELKLHLELSVVPQHFPKIFEKWNET